MLILYIYKKPALEFTSREITTGVENLNKQN